MEHPDFKNIVDNLQKDILPLKKKDITIKLKNNYSFDSSNYTFDPDSSPLAWDYYLIIYKFFNTTIEQLSRGFDGRMPNGFAKTGNPRRILGVYKNITVSGDCAFNFNEKKFIDFWSVIDNDKKKNEIEKNSMKELLLLCYLMHHSVFNFTLMPRTGGLNNKKGAKICDSQGFDRLDKFLFYMKSFFENDDQECKVLDLNNCENRTALFSFLKDEVGSFDNYCQRFYNININKDWEGITNQQDIKDCESLFNYIKLAVKFWGHQADYYDECIKNKKNPL